MYVCFGIDLEFNFVMGANKLSDQEMLFFPQYLDLINYGFRWFCILISFVMFFRFLIVDQLMGRC